MQSFFCFGGTRADILNPVLLTNVMEFEITFE